MSLFQLLLISVSFVFIIFAFDLFQRKKANFLHFVIFGGGGFGVIIIALNPIIVDKLGVYFGIARGADLFFVLAIITLFYFYIELLNAHTKQVYHFSRFVSAEAINGIIPQISTTQLPQNSLYDEYMFIVRAYNEEKTIGTVIDNIINAGFSKILVINDGSQDDTPSIVIKKQALYHDKHIFLISHRINRGGGAGNKTAIECMKHHHKFFNINYVVGFDSDNQMNIEDMNTFIARIEASKKIPHPPVVRLGSRFVDGGSAINIPLSRKIILRGAKIVTYIFNHVRISDSHNGYRVFRVEAFIKLHLTSDGMAYANEINDQIRIHNFIYEEVPVHINYTAYSLKKGQKSSNAINIALELIYKKLFFK